MTEGISFSCGQAPGGSVSDPDSESRSGGLKKDKNVKLNNQNIILQHSIVQLTSSDEKILYL